MLKDNELPKVGDSANCLGVRVPDDVQPDADDNVLPYAGGMSVAPAWRKLPIHRIPRRLRSLMPAATGSNAAFCWRSGSGTFSTGPFAEDLVLNVDSRTHGTIEPDCKTPISEFRAALARTRECWEIDET
jgi:hypothetical protein